ncbi:hypothetical protein EDB84DRAFT_1495063, partial [Lactarius hengduanensis]
MYSLFVVHCSLSPTLITTRTGFRIPISSTRSHSFLDDQRCSLDSARDQGGKDHALAHYIFTEPAPITHAILNYLGEDNDDIELG